MPRTIVSAGELSIDPNDITRIEIDETADLQACVRVFLKADARPRPFLFSDKAVALAFYRSLWAARSVGRTGAESVARETSSSSSSA